MGESNNGLSHFLERIIVFFILFEIHGLGLGRYPLHGIIGKEQTMIRRILDAFLRAMDLIFI